jgi:hypothetical protein
MKRFGENKKMAGQVPGHRNEQVRLTPEIDPGRK